MDNNEVYQKISIVIPLYNEEENVEKVVSSVGNILAPVCDYELILVDDGSTDATLAEIVRIADREERVFYLSLSRNFGHQNALRSGLDLATGEAVVTMDGDMQHPPEVILQMLQKWREGYDVVFTVREDSDDISWFKRKTSDLFYKIVNKISGIGLRSGAADFRLLDRKVVDVIKGLNERAIFYRGIIAWVGFHQCSISYTPRQRAYGVTKYTLRKMFRLAIDGITAFSFLPLRLAAMAGFFIAFFSFLYVFYAIYIKFFTTQAISGWLSIMSGIYFLGGVQLIFIGICGEYIGRIFMEVKGRPHYIVAASKVPDKAPR